jgi:hypothetical protein
MTATLADRAKSGYALAHHEGEAFWLLGMLETVKIGRPTAAARTGLLEIVVPARPRIAVARPPRRGRVVLRARRNLTFYVGDTRLDLTAGGFAFGPKNVPHTFLGTGPEPNACLGRLRADAVRGVLAGSRPAGTVTFLPPPFDGPPPDVESSRPDREAGRVIILGPPDRRPDA